MGVKEAFKNFGQKSRDRKELIRRMDEQIRMEKLVQDRQLSSNERELNQLRNEKREEQIKEELDFRRKERQQDIDFGHNPLDAENIVNKTQWEVLKEKNQFAGRGNIFQGQESVLKNDPKLLQTNQKLLKGGNMFKI